MPKGLHDVKALATSAVSLLVLLCFVCITAEPPFEPYMYELPDFNHPTQLAQCHKQALLRLCMNEVIHANACDAQSR